MMSRLQVLPTRTLSVKVSVRSLTGPDTTSNETIWVRAGGAMLAIWVGFVLLSAGQPFGWVANVAAMPTAATAASVSAMPAITSGLAITVWRNRGCQGNRSMVSSSVVWASCPSPVRRWIPSREREVGTAAGGDRTTVFAALTLGVP